MRTSSPPLVKQPHGGAFTPPWDSATARAASLKARRQATPASRDGGAPTPLTRLLLGFLWRLGVLPWPCDQSDPAFAGAEHLPKSRRLSCCHGESPASFDFRPRGGVPAPGALPWRLPPLGALVCFLAVRLGGDREQVVWLGGRVYIRHTRRSAQMPVSRDRARSAVVWRLAARVR